MAVSVALCTHNGQRFIEAQLRSIFEQTVVPDELVVSDDASTDGTLARLAAVVADYPDSGMRVRVIENAVGLGVTKNFEQAILACTGDIVLLCDQDDVWSPRRVELTLDAFSDDEVMLVHSDASLIDAAGRPLAGSLFEAYGIDEAARRELATGGAFDLFMRRNLVTGATTGVRRELAVAAAPFPAGWVHDEWLAIVAASVGRIRPLADQLIAYRQHGANEIGAVKLTLGAKLRRLVAPGASRNRTLLARAESLAERYPQLGERATDARISAVQHKLVHEQVRSALSPHRIARVSPVLREARTGRYRRFGGGLQDIARDLLQPLTPPG